MCGWKDRCRDGNLRTYCHVSPILFGLFFLEASPTCFCIYVKCFFCNLLYLNADILNLTDTNLLNQPTDLVTPSAELLKLTSTDLLNQPTDLLYSSAEY